MTLTIGYATKIEPVATVMHNLIAEAEAARRGTLTTQDLT